MSEYTGRTPESRVSTSFFQYKIDAITNRSLLPENIDHYADDALDDLILIIDEVTEAYTSQPTLLHTNGNSTEAASFNYFGLNENKINSTLDHISSVAEIIRNLEPAIKRISTSTDRIILPPDDSEIVLTANDGSFKERRVVPRLKTIVLLLSSRFGVNIDDPDQFRITSGEVDDRMMRRESYQLLEVPSLERDLLVCDEEGNATFVFDRAKLADAGISSTDLISFSKAEIIQLLNVEPTLGTRLIYSENYVEKVASLLEELHPESDIPATLGRADKLLLRTERAPEGYVTKTKLAALLFDKDLRVRIDLAIKDLGDELGEVLQAKGGSGKVADYYSPDQQQKIKEWIETNGYMLPPEDYYPLVALPEKIPLDKITIAKLIELTKDELGEVFFGARGSRPTHYYSPDQISIIMQYAESHDYLSHAPEGYLSARSIANSLDIGSYAVRSVIRSIEPDFVKKRGKITELYFSPAKQAAITSLLEERGHLTEIPQGYKSKADFADTLGVEVSLIGRLVTVLETELGATLRGRRKNGILTEFLSPDQQKYIEKWMRERHYFTHAPEGYLTVVDLAKKLSVPNPSTIQSAVKRVGAQLGEAMLARGRNGSPSHYYSPTQQEQIESYLGSRSN